MYEVVISDPDGYYYRDDRYFSMKPVKMEPGYFADHIIPIHWQGTCYYESVVAWKIEITRQRR